MFVPILWYYRWTNLALAPIQAAAVTVPATARVFTFQAVGRQCGEGRA
jgi:hypothetical protein